MSGPARKVSWLELLFDLVMVAYIGQIAHTMHGDPGWAAALTYFVLLAAAWWAWINATLTMSLFGARVSPAIWVAVTTGMIALGFMAAAVPDALGDRAAAFALGNAVIRIVWMLPWLAKRRTTGTPWWRPVLYCLAPDALWVGSIAFEPPWRFVLWGAAIAIEILLLTGLGGSGRWTRSTLGGQGSWISRNLDVGHVIERVSLLVVIVFGESVLSIITELDEHWMPATWIAGILAFIGFAVLAWTFFAYAPDAVERGLTRLQSRGSVAGLRDSLMYLPILLIAGVGLFAAGLGTAVADATEHLPFGAAVCLSAGVSLFFAASAGESLRYGAPLRDIVLWGPAGIAMPWLLVPLNGVLSAVELVAASVAIVGIIAVLNGLNVRRVRHAIDTSRV